MEPEHLRLGWCLVAPNTVAELAPVLPSPRPGDVWSVSSCLNNVQSGPQEWDDWYIDLDTARQDCEASPAAGVRVVELAVDAADADRLLACGAQADGWNRQLLRQGVPSPRTSTTLGYEIVGGQDYLFHHSWYCFSYPQKFARPPHNATINEHGLVDDHAVADRVLAACQAERGLHSERWVALRLTMV